MSRITGSDALKMFEAYAAVYAPQELTEEQVWEEVETWVNSLLEEGYDLSEYTWEEMYEAYIEEKSPQSAGEFYSTPGKPKPTTAQQQSGTRKALQAGKVVSVASNLGGLRSGTTVKMDSAATREGGKTVLRATTQQGADSPEKSIRLGGSSYDRLTTNDGVRYIERKTATKKPPAAQPPAAPRPAAPAGPRPAAPAGPRPAAPKVAPTKPVAAAQTGDKVKDMATWAKANPKLAAAAAERARTRGTSATTNPQMDGLKSRLPAPAAPKVSPSNTLSNTVAAASKPAAFSPAPEVKATTIAAAPKPAPVSPRQARLNMEMEYDAYDVVLEYLLSQGHAETVEEAHYVMLEMDAETIGTIVEAASDQSDKQIDKGVKTTYKAKGTLANQASRGLNRLPANQRAAKTKRMQGRLETRRDDLFRERNKREDAVRTELRQKYGL